MWENHQCNTNTKTKNVNETQQSNLHRGKSSSEKKRKPSGETPTKKYLKKNPQTLRKHTSAGSVDDYTKAEIVRRRIQKSQEMG